MYCSPAFTHLIYPYPVTISFQLIVTCLAGAGIQKSGSPLLKGTKSRKFKNMSPEDQAQWIENKARQAERRMHKTEVRRAQKPQSMDVDKAESTHPSKATQKMALKKKIKSARRKAQFASSKENKKLRRLAAKVESVVKDLTGSAMSLSNGNGSEELSGSPNEKRKAVLRSHVQMYYSLDPTHPVRQLKHIRKVIEQAAALLGSAEQNQSLSAGSDDIDFAVLDALEGLSIGVQADSGYGQIENAQVQAEVAPAQLQDTPIAAFFQQMSFSGWGSEETL